VFDVTAGPLAAYLVWLVVRGPRALQLGVTNGWVGTAFRLAAGVVCFIFGERSLYNVRSAAARQCSRSYRLTDSAMHSLDRALDASRSPRRETANFRRRRGWGHL
jgi:hypothetical protein